MKHFLSLVYIILFSLQSGFSQDDNSIVSGTRFAINSNILNEERTCLISLPDSYSDESYLERTYPVIILLDGYVHFKTTAGIVHFMSSSRNRNYSMPESIIIAIENVDRERDFTVTKIKTKRPNTMGGGRNFLSFIEKELIPFIDKNYRTETYRTLIGHSLGGLLATNSFMDKNSVFDAYLAIDPSIWWNEEMTKSKVDAVHPAALNKRLFIATANQGERNYERNKKRHDLLYELLKTKSGDNSKIKIAYYANEDHRSVPLIAIYDGLKYLHLDN